MAMQTVDITPIRVGLPWSITLELLTDAGAADNVFTLGRTFVGRCWRGGSASVLATATVTRISDNVATITLSEAQTSALSSLPFKPDADGVGVAPILIDIIRTDTNPDEAIDVLIAAEVWQQPV